MSKINVSVLQDTSQESPPVSKPTPKPESPVARTPPVDTSKEITDRNLPTSSFKYKPPSPSHQGPQQVPGSPSYHPQPVFSAPSQPEPVQNGPSGDHHVSSSLLEMKDEPSRLPPSQSPFITLLQKNRGV